MPSGGGKALGNLIGCSSQSRVEGGARPAGGGACVEARHPAPARGIDALLVCGRRGRGKHTPSGALAPPGTRRERGATLFLLCWRWAEPRAEKLSWL